MKYFNLSIAAMVVILTASFSYLKQTNHINSKSSPGCYREISPVPTDIPPYNGNNFAYLPLPSPIDNPKKTEPFEPEIECPLPIPIVCCYLVEVLPVEHYYVVGVCMVLLKMKTNEENITQGVRFITEQPSCKKYFYTEFKNDSKISKPILLIISKIY